MLEDDDLNPPEDSFPDEVEGAIYYVWDPVNKQWQPVFAQEGTA